MSHSKFYSSLRLLIVLNVIIKPVWIFGIDRQVQNITGVAEYGIYFSLLNLSIVFGFLLDWGLNSFINRELAAKKTELEQQLGSFLLLKLIFFLIYIIIVVLVAKLSGVEHWNILWGVIVIQFLTFLFLFLRNVITANQWFKTDAFLSVLDKTLMILFCGAFILLPAFFGSINIQRFLVAQIVSTSFAIMVVIIILLSRKIHFKKPSLRFFDRSILLSVLPFAFVIFLMSVHNRLDGFLLERLHMNGAHQAGIYAAAYRLLDASNMVGYLIASFFLPFVARLWTDGKPFQEIILQTRHIQLMFAVTVSAVAIVMAPWLQKILYHRNDEYGVRILQSCLPALVGYGFTQVYGTVMTATGSVIKFCYLNFAAVVMNILLNLLLIPNYGALGCCIAALCSQLCLGISTMIFVHRRFGISIGVKSLIFYALNGLIICGVLYALIQTPVNHLFLLPIAGLVTVSIMWFSKMISLNSWLNFIKKQ